MEIVNREPISFEKRWDDDNAVDWSDPRCPQCVHFGRIVPSQRGVTATGDREGHAGPGLRGFQIARDPNFEGHSLGLRPGPGIRQNEKRRPRVEQGGNQSLDRPLGENLKSVHSVGVTRVIVQHDQLATDLLDGFAQMREIAGLSATRVEARRH